ncbi:hypothetical protein BKA83DRAFT_647724, partial [Pisolithus microcarpus]
HSHRIRGYPTHNPCRRPNRHLRGPSLVRTSTTGTSTPLRFPLGSSPTYSLALNYLPHPQDQWKIFQKFIAYPPRRMKLHPSVAFTALVLPQRLKARFPTARGSSSHRLFISAFMLASKVICNDTCSNKSWSVVARGMFQLQEINQMEREIHGPFDTR